MLLKCHTYGAKDKQPLVLLHPGGSLHHIWQPFIRAWSDQYRIFAFDVHPGTQNAPVPLVQVAEQIWAALAARGIQSTALIGASMGANIALNMAVLAPKEVHLLVLDSAQSGAPKPARSIRMLLSAMGLLASVLPRKLVEEFLLKQFEHLSAEDKVLVREDFAQMGKLAFVQHAKASLHHDVSTSAHQIQAPTLILAGEKDILTRSGEHSKLASRIPANTLRIIPKSGHVTFLRNPTAFRQFVDEFLQQKPLSAKRP